MRKEKTYIFEKQEFTLKTFEIVFRQEEHTKNKTEASTRVVTLVDAATASNRAKPGRRGLQGHIYLEANSTTISCLNKLRRIQSRQSISFRAYTMFCIFQHCNTAAVVRKRVTMNGSLSSCLGTGESTHSDEHSSIRNVRHICCSEIMLQVMSSCNLWLYMTICIHTQLTQKSPNRPRNVL